MTRHETTSRREVLRRGAVATGAVVFGGTTVVGRAVAQDEETGLAAQIESHGHYAWFPLGPESWARSGEPYDMQDGESRWMAEPTRAACAFSPRTSARNRRTGTPGSTSTSGDWAR